MGKAGEGSMWFCSKPAVCQKSVFWQNLRARCKHFAYRQWRELSFDIYTVGVCLTRLGSSGLCVILLHHELNPNSFKWPQLNNQLVQHPHPGIFGQLCRQSSQHYQKLALQSLGGFVLFNWFFPYEKGSGNFRWWLFGNHLGIPSTWKNWLTKYWELRKWWAPLFLLCGVLSRFFSAKFVQLTFLYEKGSKNIRWWGMRQWKI